MSFTFAMKAEEVHARLYQEALENLNQTEEVFYYLSTATAYGGQSGVAATASVPAAPSTYASMAS